MNSGVISPEKTGQELDSQSETLQTRHHHCPKLSWVAGSGHPRQSGRAWECCNGRVEFTTSEQKAAKGDLNAL